MIIAIDFDGTIVEHRFPEIGQEKPGAFLALRRLAEDGHKLVLWTVREGKLLDDAILFCKERGVEFYAVNCDQPGENWANSAQSRKLSADLFIDDCNLGGLPDWDMIYTMISEKLTFVEAVQRITGVEPKEEQPSHHRHHHHKKRKPGLFARLRARCSDARAQFTGNGSHFGSSSRHHW